MKMMIEQKVDDFLNYLLSADTSQKYLKNCYQYHHLEDAEKNSYENSYRFLYYLEHGQTFFKTGDKSDIVIKPILYFYGMVHLLKACLLTRRPNYPENTTMLAHGVSTRKRKKQQYSFLQDEVKVQHKGLFPYFSANLFGLEQFSYEKIDMNQLLATIPELNNMFMQHRDKAPLINIGNLNSTKLFFTVSLFDSYHMTEKKFTTYITKHLPNVEEASSHGKQFILQLAKPLQASSKGPFYYHVREQAFYFPMNRHYFSTYHEVMSHYLLLYNLSMISRYETEWWGELTHMLPTEDFPFIKQFLSVTSVKVPFLLGYFLYNQKEASG